MGERVVAVGVDSKLCEDEVGFERSREVGDGGVECLVPETIVGVGSQGYVDAVAFTVADADFVWSAGSGEEPLAGFVDGYGHRSFSFVEPGLDAVAVVHIDVDVKDAESLFDEMLDSDYGIVEDAEPGCAVAHGVVVHAAGGDECVFGLAAEDAFGGEHRATGGEGGVAIHAGAWRVVAGAESKLVHCRDYATSVDGFDDVDVIGVVEDGDLVVGG